ncbi:unnamed protein product [Staurois parvus]|uniref:Uncharacterized protein n=1 Tax=Staurois parvus TaxID=386267 RepID=A0ABN9FFQ7_9NEOB|nr:unnamed protein product [Staurois parvus]
MLYDRAIVIQSVRALKRENWPGQEGGKLPGIEMVNVIALKAENCPSQEGGGKCADRKGVKVSGLEGGESVRTGSG